jgi:hypothetical protein
MSSNPSTKSGVKGSDVYETTGDPRVDLSVVAVRGATNEQIKPLMKALLENEGDSKYEDAFVLAFQTRNIRGGKGERDVAYMMFSMLLKYTPYMIEMLDLIPHFGCWRDLFTLASALLNPTSESEAVRYLPIKNAVVHLAITQLRKDLATEEKKPISLCAKWAPREGKGDAREQTLAREMAAAMFPEVVQFSSRQRLYRKTLSALNRRLQTTEVKMCANDWEVILPTVVPGRCLEKNRKAFLNEVVARRGRRVRGGELRHPENEVRMACREHFQEHFAAAARGEVTLKGSDTVYPHEVIKKILESYCYDQYYGEGPKLTQGEYNLVLGQWRGFVETAHASGAFRDCVAMCDFSGSMDGTPKLVSMALGMLIAEVSGSNKFLTFDSDPKWHQMRPEDNILNRVEAVGQIGQGTSTDFQKAMDLILADVKARRLRPEQIPKDLIVFTDMGFDQAYASDRVNVWTGHSYRNVVKTGPWQTHIQMIREAWKRTGEDMWGTGNAFVPPRIVIWNLSAEYKDFHATADEDGVIMLSGWSPSLFKVIQETRVEVLTPMQGLRLQLDNTMYEVVRERLRSLMA